MSGPDPRILYENDTLLLGQLSRNVVIVCAHALAIMYHCSSHRLLSHLAITIAEYNAVYLPFSYDNPSPMGRYIGYTNGSLSLRYQSVSVVI